MTKTFEIIIHVTGTKAEIEKAQKHLEKGPNSIRVQSAKELQEPSKK